MPKSIRMIPAIAAGFAGLLLLAGVPGHAGAAEPKIYGQMQTFQLAPSTRARPTVTWKDDKGEEVSLKDFDGKVVLVNFWATWCPPCIRELPSLARLQKGLGGDDFEVVAISIDQGGKRVAGRMLRRLKITDLDLYLDQKSDVAKFMRVKTMPTTVLFDRQGREVGKMEGGAEWDTKEAAELVKFFIDNPAYADKLRVRKSPQGGS